MKKTNPLLVFFLLVSLHGFSKVWTISDTKLNLQFDDQTALLKVTDLRCNKTWEQKDLDQTYTVLKTQQKENSIFVEMKGKLTLNVRFSLTPNAGLEVAILSNNKEEMADLAYPPAFSTPNDNHYVLQTDGERLLLPVNDTEYPLGNGISFYCGGGLSMAWMGMTDRDFKTGYMTILETPYDAALETVRERGLITFRPVWRASMGTFSYERKLKYVFFDQGGYVAQCKEF
jgi:hypothetical protein